MNVSLLVSSALLAATGSAVPSSESAPSRDFVVHSGEYRFYDTRNGPVVLDNLVIEEDGVLRVHGPYPLVALVRETIRIDGCLDLSGRNARDVATLNTGHIPEPGGNGGPGGGRGGTGSWVTNNSTPHGGPGFGFRGIEEVGGQGGETGYSPSADSDHRRPGGGGGGALALDQPVSNDPDDPANDGLVAEDGHQGHDQSFGAMTNMQPSMGGAVGAPIFLDGDPTNDFWGRKLDPATGTVILGELTVPTGGRGGGAGGDACPAASFPTPNWSIASDEKGGPGGGGGGLGLIFTSHLVLGEHGYIFSDGGFGGQGENTLWLNSIGGDGGGGSGGYLVLQAFQIDLRQASANSITALGGPGAIDLDSYGGIPPISAGGNGGPGVIQLHTPSGAGVLLPPGVDLAELTSPDAHSLLPIR